MCHESIVDDARSARVASVPARLECVGSIDSEPGWKPVAMRMHAIAVRFAVDAEAPARVGAAVRGDRRHLHTRDQLCNCSKDIIQSLKGESWQSASGSV